MGNHGGSRGRWWVRSVGDGGYFVVVGDGDPGRGRWRSLSWAMVTVSWSWAMVFWWAMVGSFGGRWCFGGRWWGSVGDGGGDGKSVSCDLIVDFSPPPGLKRRGAGPYVV